MKNIFNIIAILVAVFGTTALFFASQFSNMVVDAICFVLCFCIGYFICFFQKQQQ
jgi:hypothetical protein